jgi:hypothetical protein
MADVHRAPRADIYCRKGKNSLASMTDIQLRKKSFSNATCPAPESNGGLLHIARVSYSTASGRAPCTAGLDFTMNVGIIYLRALKERHACLAS